MTQHLRATHNSGSQRVRHCPNDIDEFDSCAPLFGYRCSLGGDAAWRWDIGVRSVLCASRKLIVSCHVGMIRYVFRFLCGLLLQIIALAQQRVIMQTLHFAKHTQAPLFFYMFVNCVFGAACVRLKHDRNPCFIACSGRGPRNMPTCSFHADIIRL